MRTDCSRLYRRGRVAGLDGRMARIIFDSLEGCSGCAGSCGIAQIVRLTGAGRRGVLQVDVGLQSGLVTGDAVRVGIEAGRLLRLVFITYFLPLLGMVSGAVLAAILAPATGDVGTLSGAVIGGLVIGGLLIALSASSKSGHSLKWLGARVTKMA
jgi:positive regulator of sigma E activity